MCLFLVLVLETLPPPTALDTGSLGLENKTLGLDDVEEELPHQVGRSRIRHLKTGTESGERMEDDRY